jgi:uncharacterized zinc-type alcohol dehydrogenase-like protein
MVSSTTSPRDLSGPARTSVHGWAAMAEGRELEPLEYLPPILGEMDVRVAVSHCGLCFTDIHAIDDFYGITAFPFVPGHEIVGHIEALGSAVSDLREGDRVGIGWQGRSCGQCRWCIRGEEHLCLDIGNASTCERHGGFADAVTVDSRFAYPVPERMASDVAAVLMCAGVAVFSPLRRYAAEGGRQVAIYGVGGLGHLAIQFARALGFAVTAVSSSAEKEREALGFGAERFVLLGDRDRMRPFDYAFDLMLCTAHGDIDWEELTDVMDKRGHIVLVGFPNVSLNPTNLVAHELSIAGSLLGNHATIREMLSFADAHGITPWIERLPMAQVNEAITRLKENRAHYRIVLSPE